MRPLVAAMSAVLAVSVLSFVYMYALYPAFLFVASRFSSPRADTAGRVDLPSVTLIVAAYNEEDVIAEKIENSLELDYPAEKLDVVVFSDASDDRTDEIVRSYADSGVELDRIEGRVGKTECQNRVAARATGEILVFSDANSMYEPDAIRELVAAFADDVGCVVGEIQHTRTEEDVTGELVFEAYKRLVKRLESEVESAVKGNGAIYAVRRSDYVPLPADAISDFAEPLAVKESGKRVTYEPDAVAWERTGGSVSVECARKIRITTRSWHTIRRHLSLFDPLKHGIYSVQLFTDTVLWWSTPLLFAGVLVSGASLAVLTGYVVFDLLVAGYVAVVVLGVSGHLLSRRRASVPYVFHLPHYFLVGNYSLVVGAWNFLRGHNIVTWETMHE